MKRLKICCWIDESYIYLNYIRNFMRVKNNHPNKLMIPNDKSSLHLCITTLIIIFAKNKFIDCDKPTIG